ncbi:hypothetical protein IW262DRAFT_1301036 [Armillaria fumosa]|nr:hypothetical protein IW262DRAFT_1301036 [Armillaria fumosa]
MAERLEEETDSIKGEILTALEELQEEIAEAESKRSLADYLEAIDQAPALLQRFLQEVAEQTGWWFSVIAGGPLPTDNGNIHTRSFHIGKTTQGRDFLDEYAAFSVDPNDPNGQRRTFEESISAPYGRFLKSLFSSEVHAQWALNQAQLDFLNKTATMDTPMASPSPTSPSPIAPVSVSPTVPQVTSSIAPVTSPTALPPPSQGVPWVPPPMDPFGSNSLNPALTPFNGLADDLNFFLVGLQQGPPEDPHVPPLPPLPPMYDDSNILAGAPEDSPFPPLPPWPPMDDNSNAQQGAPEDSHLPPLPPLPPLLPVHDDSNTMAVRGAKQAPEQAEEDDNDEGIPEVRASKCTLAEPAGQLAGSRGAFAGAGMLSQKGPYGHTIIKTFGIIALARKPSLQHLPTPTSKLFKRAMQMVERNATPLASKPNRDTTITGVQLLDGQNTTEGGAKRHCDRSGRTLVVGTRYPRS